MPRECVQCQKEGATCSFVCNKCPQPTTFFVCNRSCQVSFWKMHKKEYHSDQKMFGIESGFGGTNVFATTKEEYMESFSNPKAWFHTFGSYRGAEWLIDCYRMRADDDIAWGSFNVHGLYELGYGSEECPDGSKLATILATDFLLFLKLAIANGVLPVPEFNFCLCVGYFAPNLLPFAFCKEDAKEKWGGENVFSFRPSLRRTAEQIYGLSCNGPYNDEEAQQKGEKMQEEMKQTIRSNLDEDRFMDSPNVLFEDVGGKAVWDMLYRALVRYWNSNEEA